jgi:hypothetical protein
VAQRPLDTAAPHTLLDHNISKLFIFSKSEDVISDALSAIRSEMGDVAAKKAEWMQCDLSNRSETEKLHLRLQIRQTGLIFSLIMLREVS